MYDVPIVFVSKISVVPIEFVSSHMVASPQSFVSLKILSYEKIKKLFGFFPQLSQSLIWYQRHKVLILIRISRFRYHRQSPERRLAAELSFQFFKLFMFHLFMFLNSFLFLSFIPTLLLFLILNFFHHQRAFLVFTSLRVI